jgi:hypothetical protein
LQQLDGYFHRDDGALLDASLDQLAKFGALAVLFSAQEVAGWPAKASASIERGMCLD